MSIEGGVASGSVEPALEEELSLNIVLQTMISVLTIQVRGLKCMTQGMSEFTFA